MMYDDVRRKKRAWALEAASRYWPQGSHIISSLPIPASKQSASLEESPVMREIRLPEWASDLAPDGYLLVPGHAVIDGDGTDWTRVDWILAIAWYLGGDAECAHERRNGPIHSYAFRLRGWDSRMWDRAWVNRIALFLRRWSAQEEGLQEEDLFGSLPDPEIVITHDLDAVRKTLAIRLKQAAYLLINSVQHLLKRELRAATRKAKCAIRFMVRSGRYDQLDTIAQMERRNNVRSHINVYGGVGGWRRSPKMWFFDPAYSIRDIDLRERLKLLSQEGWTLGLHQSYKSWASESTMQAEKEHVEDELGLSISSCRQHWLRFSWHDTWKTQEKVGLVCDTTLGFNDRASFRNGAAMRYRPWDHENHCSMKIKSVPLVLMDSHLYNAAMDSEQERVDHLRYWIDEVKSVRGVASVVWHPHVLSSDYGWSAGFDNLLRMVGTA